MHAQEHILFEQILFYRFKKVRKRRMYALGIALMKNERQKRRLEKWAGNRTKT